ncbi:hypothetical protein HMPREF1051_1394 [Neisseria sicca VK64]|uniref:Uncharacterized protein n=1 Tax=Neisseria sicca VK64 TaxID=1095748 RepID=I2NNJ3_NEISI|nr:hypothetical protein HMPREF1051_1394 [Neisseria sicca VK64]
MAFTSGFLKISKRSSEYFQTTFYCIFSQILFTMSFHI